MFTGRFIADDDLAKFIKIEEPIGQFKGRGRNYFGFAIKRALVLVVRVEKDNVRILVLLNYPIEEERRGTGFTAAG